MIFMFKSTYIEPTIYCNCRKYQIKSSSKFNLFSVGYYVLKNIIYLFALFIILYFIFTDLCILIQNIIQNDLFNNILNVKFKFKFHRIYKCSCGYT